MENKDFDKYIRKGLENVQPEYDPSDWDDMEELLDKDERESRELVYIKGIELVLVLLTVVTLFRFYPDYTQISESPFQNNQSSTITMVEEDNKKSENNSNTTVNTEIDNQINTDNNVIAPKQAETTANSSIERTNTTSNYNYNKNYSVAALQSNSNNNFENKNIVIQNGIKNNSISNTTFVQDPNIGIKESIEAPIKSEVVETIEKEDFIKEYFVLNPIEMLNEDRIDFDNLEKSLAFTIAKPKFRMGFYVGTDMNFVSTPYDQDTESSFTRRNFGFSTGLRTAIQKGRWEFESGLSFSRMSYQPTPIYQITGSARDGYEAHTLKELTFNTVSMPLDLRFYFNNMSNKLKFYITTGASFNAVAWSNYNRHSYEVKEVTNPEDVIAGRPPNKIITKRAGILHGESLAGNYYITAKLGAGMEMSMNEKTSFFAEPKFTYFLLPGNTGFGPNNDQFNSVSLDIGLRFGF